MNILKKNSNAHFTYNLGVDFIRLSIILVLLWTIFVVYQLAIKKPEAFNFIENKAFTVITEREKKSKRHYDNTNDHYETRYYYVHYANFCDDEGSVTKQKITEDVYHYYSKFAGTEIYLSAYKDYDDEIYITLPSTDAAKEYRTVYASDFLYNLAYSSSIMGYLILLLLFTMGLGQIGLSRKYAPKEAKAVAPAMQKEAEDLLEQFDKTVEGSHKKYQLRESETQENRPKKSTEEMIADSQQTDDLLIQLDKILEDNQEYKYKK